MSPLLLSTLFLTWDLLLSLKPCTVARLTGQGALGIHLLSLYPQCWDCMYASMPIFYVGAGDTNSGLRAYTDRALTHLAISSATW